MTRLTTVATFDQPASAQIARQFLELAGIDAVVADQEIVAMDWLLSPAVGGIKVQVREEDAERAAEILNDKLGPRSGLVAEGLDEAELERQALAEAPVDEPPPPEEPIPEPPPPVADGDDPPPDPLERENYARRAVLAACLGLLVPPVQFYALYLWFNAAFGDGPLSTRGKWNLLAATLLLGFLWPLLLYGCVGFGVAY